MEYITHIVITVVIVVAFRFIVNYLRDQQKQISENEFRTKLLQFYVVTLAEIRRLLSSGKITADFFSGIQSMMQLYDMFFFDADLTKDNKSSDKQDDDKDIEESNDEKTDDNN